MSLRRNCIALTFVCLTLSLAAQTTNNTAAAATATVPRLITFTGTLSTGADGGESGVLVAPGTTRTHVVAVTFSLYAEQTGGAPLWSEVQNVHVDSGGRYTVQLGASQPDGLPMDIFTSVQAQWLGVQREGQAEEPRVLLVSVPYALKSGDAETFGGLPPSAYALVPQSNQPPGRGPGGGGNGGNGGLRNDSPHQLPINGGGTTNYIPLWTNASSLASSSIYQSGNLVGIGTTTPLATLDVNTVGSSDNAVLGYSGAASGNTVGVLGVSSSSSGVGVSGTASASIGGTSGVFGLTVSTGDQASGVYGKATATSGDTNGVLGSNASNRGTGVYGIASSTRGTNYGVFGLTLSTGDLASGVSGSATASSGDTYGVYGQSDSDTGSGVRGVTTSTSGTNYGVYGQSSSSGGTGVYGNATSTDTSGFAIGVYGQSNTGDGVFGTSSGNSGVVGMAGYSNVQCCTNAVAGINVATAGHNNGVYGESDSPLGVGGLFENTAGGGALIILGRVSPSTNLFTVDGNGDVFVDGDLETGGGATFGAAVQIDGNLNVTGTLSKGGGMFKIDDPLDPANKYLSHSFVESPDMMNIYNGSVRLDAHGQAWVTLPQYFEALNRDFQYVLTSVGSSQPRLYVAREIKGNRFKIAGGRPNGKVSWMVTGIRQDAWANANRIPNEEDKPPAERGHYLHPELFGAPASQGIHNAAVHTPAGSSAPTGAGVGN